MNTSKMLTLSLLVSLCAASAHAMETAPVTTGFFTTFKSGATNFVAGGTSVLSGIGDLAKRGATSLFNGVTSAPSSVWNSVKSGTTTVVEATKAGASFAREQVVSSPAHTAGVVATTAAVVGCAYYAWKNNWVRSAWDYTLDLVGLS